MQGGLGGEVKAPDFFLVTKGCTCVTTHIRTHYVQQFVVCVGVSSDGCTKQTAKMPRTPQGEMCCGYQGGALKEKTQVRSRGELLFTNISCVPVVINPTGIFKIPNTKRPERRRNISRWPDTHNADTCQTGLCQSAKAEMSQAVAAVASKTSILLHRSSEGRRSVSSCCSAESGFQKLGRRRGRLLFPKF